MTTKTPHERVTVTWRSDRPTVLIDGEKPNELVEAVVDAIMDEAHGPDDDFACEDNLRWKGWHDEFDCEHDDESCPHIAKSDTTYDDLVLLALRLHDDENHHGPAMWCEHAMCRAAADLSHSNVLKAVS